MITGGHVKHLLMAYVHGELPDHLRQRVVRHLDRCDACYAAMQHERDLQQQLSAGLQTLGQRPASQLAALLPDILAESKRNPRPRRSSLSYFSMAVAVALVIGLLLPVLIAPTTALADVPHQPSPLVVLATATPNSTDSPRSAASPTAVAERVNDEAADLFTGPMNPSPVPMADTPTN